MRFQGSGPTSEERIAQSLGEISGTLSAVAKQQDAAGKKLDALAKNQSDIVADVRLRDLRFETLEERVSKTEITTDAVNSWKSQVTGIAVTLGVVGTIVIGALTYFKTKVMALIGG